MKSILSGIMKSTLKWYQFSLRMLLVVVTLFALLCSYFAVVRERVRKKREAVEAIGKLGGAVIYDFEQDAKNTSFDPPIPPAPDILIRKFGIDFFADAAEVKFGQQKIRDQDLQWLRGMTKLNHLQIASGDITDAGISNIAGLTRIENLYLEGTSITDQGLKYLEGFSNLRYFVLSRTGITGVGFKYLRGLPIDQLDLDETPFNDEGMEQLEALESLDRLNLSETQISDKGMRHLRPLKRLQFLDLVGDNITDAGLANLRPLTQLKSLRLNKTRITDDGLRHLGDFEELESVDLSDTLITERGLKILETMKNIGFVFLEHTNIPKEKIDEFDEVMNKRSEIKRLGKQGPRND